METFSALKISNFSVLVLASVRAIENNLSFADKETEKNNAPAKRLNFNIDFIMVDLLINDEAKLASLSQSGYNIIFKNMFYINIK